MTKSINYILIWLSIITAIINFNACSLKSTIIGDANNIQGEYASVSESEWHQILTLKGNGIAELRTITWIPGDPESEKEKRQTFQWTYKVPNVELNSGNVKILLEYKDNIDLYKSFHINGIEGIHPGLSPIQTKKDKEIVFQTLWREPRTFIVKMYEITNED